MARRMALLVCLLWLIGCPVQDGDDNETNGTTESESET